TTQDNTYGKFQSMVESGTTEWDVVEINPDFQVIGAQRGLLEPLDFGVINREPIMTGEGFVTDYSVPQVLWSYVLGYNTDLLKTAPTSTSAMFDLASFAGKRSIYTDPNSSTLETALLAAGVAPGDLYPLDLDRAFAKLDEIRAELVFYETNAQAQQYVTDGTASMLMIPDGRAMAAINGGAPVGILYEQSFMTWSSMVVPKGCPNRENAMKLLAWTMTAEAQAAIANAYTYGPVVPAAFDLIAPERANILSGGPQQQGKFIMINAEWWAENYEDAAERLTEWRLM
ncbi:MAG: extracellular solute-binding protein, partial [Gemmobacter sp.]|nr:extracellular solute-binding protein [Gemmobacter sp.]